MNRRFATSHLARIVDIRQSELFRITKRVKIGKRKSRRLRGSIGRDRRTHNSVSTMWMDVRYPAKRVDWRNTRAVYPTLGSLWRPGNRRFALDRGSERRGHGIIGRIRLRQVHFVEMYGRHAASLGVVDRSARTVWISRLHPAGNHPELVSLHEGA